VIEAQDVAEFVKHDTRELRRIDQIRSKHRNLLLQPAIQIAANGRTRDHLRETDILPLRLIRHIHQIKRIRACSDIDIALLEISTPQDLRNIRKLLREKIRPLQALTELIPLDDHGVNSRELVGRKRVVDHQRDRSAPDGRHERVFLIRWHGGTAIHVRLPRSLTLLLLLRTAAAGETPGRENCKTQN
jgi:hypothetical protein